MKRSPDNQINTFSHWHLENKMASFFYYGRLSSAQLDGWLSTSAQSNRRHTTERSKTMNINPSWLVRRRNRSWIKGLGKNPKRVNSFIACSAFCLGPPNHDHMDSEKRLRVYKSSATMARRGTPRVACWQGSRQNTQKSECAFRRSPIRRSPKKLCVYTASDVNWLNICLDVAFKL